MPLALIIPDVLTWLKQQSELSTSNYDDIKTIKQV